jgi:phosphate transport system substrate-binding protein
MKRRLRKIITLLIVCVFVVGAFGACGKKSGDQSSNKESNTSSEDNTSGTKDLSGSISMAGSTSMEKVANALAEGFMAKNPNVQISPEFTGSGAGIEALTAGTINIGNSSRALTDDEKGKGAVENTICLDGIATIVDPANKVKNLTKDQLTQIYTGKVTNWKDVGGSDTPIVVIGREAGSGTRDAFEELLGVKDTCKYSNEINSTGGVLAKVASTPGSIGYVSLDVLDDSVIALSIDGVEPTVDNIKAKKYLLQRPFVMATMGEISKQTDLVKAFFDYVQSDEGQKIISDAGLITLDK